MSTKRKIIFVSSPYTHNDPDVRENNFSLVSQYVAELNSKSIVALSPITYGHTLLNFKTMPTDWEFWKEFCITFLEKCEEMHVYKIPGWDKSRGVKEEIAIAEELGIKITYKKPII